MKADSAETKLAAARTKLILDKPFLGALVLRLPMVAAKDDWCQTTATDARKFYFNREFIDSLSLSQTQFMLAHEALHCALSHFARRQHRIKQRWDLACDYAINPLLIEDGLTPPPNSHIMPEYLGMTAEEIYPLIDENDQTDTLDEHVYDKENQNDGGRAPPPPGQPENNPKQGRQPEPDDNAGEDAPAGREDGGERDQRDDRGSAPNEADSPDAEGEDGVEQPSPLDAQEREDLDVQWQQRLAGAAQQAMQSGKLGGSMARLVEHLLQPRLPWRMLLARYMSNLARDDFSYMRPSRREGDAILPSLRSAQIDLAIGIDTSGSIKPAEFHEFLAEIDAIKGQLRARVTVLPCDASLVDGAPWIFEPWEEIKLPERIGGGGGTRFVPVFEWLEQRNIPPELLVYFTDAEGEFPEREPAYPVIWLVKGRQKVPWGTRIQLN